MCGSLFVRLELRVGIGLIEVREDEVVADNGELYNLSFRVVGSGGCMMEAERMRAKTVTSERWCLTVSGRVCIYI